MRQARVLKKMVIRMSADICFALETEEKGLQKEER